MPVVQTLTGQRVPVKIWASGIDERAKGWYLLLIGY
jgi:hypothetical protein